MRILIRADTSDGVGTGHLVRCLALAAGLRELGARVTLACTPTPPHVSRMVSEAGCDLVDVASGSVAAKRRATEELLAAADQHADVVATRNAIPEGMFDWVVVDHYGLDARWERAMRACARRVLAIDDLTSRPHDCDLLLDQNPGADRDARHRAMSGSAPRRLLGPRYALLRPGFAAARARSGVREGSLGRILVMYGGMDPTGETMKALRAMQRLPSLAVRIDVVAGSANRRCDPVRAECARDARMRFHLDAANIPELMAGADIALGACGTSSWERCCMYLPAIAIIAAENQREIAAGLAKAGAAEILGWHADVTSDNLVRAVERMAGSPERLRAMSVRAGDLADGRGVARALEAMEALDAHSRVLH
jgi:UDP-2,4-diacetamido-2,4,6-trideoxy-beta-L-altropyranose hydrolase